MAPFPDPNPTQTQSHSTGHCPWGAQVREGTRSRSAPPLRQTAPRGSSLPCGFLLVASAPPPLPVGAKTADLPSHIKLTYLGRAALDSQNLEAYRTQDREYFAYNKGPVLRKINNSRERVSLASDPTSPVLTEKPNRLRHIKVTTLTSRSQFRRFMAV